MEHSDSSFGGSGRYYADLASAESKRHGPKYDSKEEAAARRILHAFGVRP